MFQVLKNLPINIFNEYEGSTIVKLFFYYLVFTFFRGLIDAGSSEDYINLFSSGVVIFFLYPLLIVLGTNKIVFFIMFDAYLRYGFLLTLLLLITTKDNGPLGFISTLSPDYYFVLITPYFKKYVRLIIYPFLLLLLVVDFTVRSNYINFIFCILISITYYYRFKSITKTIIKYARLFFFFIPFFFLFLSIFNGFNIFDIGSRFNSLVVEDNTGKTQDLFIDTRTSVYKDVILDLNKSNSIFFGLGANGKTMTTLVEDKNFDYNKIYHEGRRDSESGLLNLFQYGGIFLVLSYFLLLFKASYLAIYKSRSWVSVMLGLWVSYNFLFSFIERPLIISVSNIFLFLVIGLCFNKRFRNLNDYTIKCYWYAK